MKKIILILFLFSCLRIFAQEGITNIINSNAVTIGGSSPSNGGVFIERTSSQEKLIVTSSTPTTPGINSIGTQDIDVTVMDNTETITFHKVIGITGATHTPKDVIIDQQGYVVIAGTVVNGVNTNGFILRVDLANLTTSTYMTYTLSTPAVTDLRFHQVLELNLAASVKSGRDQMAVLASGNIVESGVTYRKDFILLIDQLNLALNSATMIDMGNTRTSRALSSALEGYRTMTETGNSLCVAGAFQDLSGSRPFDFGLHIVEFTYNASANLVRNNQVTFESGTFANTDWALPHDMTYINTNGGELFLAGAKYANPSSSELIPLYMRYNLGFGSPTTNYIKEVPVVATPIRMINSQMSSKMQVISSDIFVGNNNGDLYVFAWATGILTPFNNTKSVKDIFRPSSGTPNGDFVYDPGRQLFYGVTQGSNMDPLTVFNMDPTSTSGCCFTTRAFSSNSLAPFINNNHNISSASGSNSGNTISYMNLTVVPKTACQFCNSNTMTVTGPTNVYCKADFAFNGCEHYGNFTWELVGPWPAPTVYPISSAPFVATDNHSATINFNGSGFSFGAYIIRFRELIISTPPGPPACSPTLASTTFNYMATPTFTGTISMMNVTDCDDEKRVFELSNPQGLPLTSFSWSSSPNGTPVNATVNPVTIDYTGYTGSFTVSVDVSIGGCPVVTKTFNFTKGIYQTLQKSYKHSYTGKTLGEVVDNNDYTWVLQDLGSQEYGLSQVDKLGKILQSHRYKGASTNAFTAVDVIKSRHSPTTPGVVVVGGMGNKLYVVETDGSGAVVRQRAFTISTCEVCSVEVVNIVPTTYETAEDGYNVLINIKNTSTGANSVHMVQMSALLVVSWVSKLSINSSNTTFIAHRLFTHRTYEGTSLFMVLGTITIDGVKKGIVYNPGISMELVQYGNYYRISNNVYFDGRPVFDPNYYEGRLAKYFIFGGSTDATGFNMNANAAFLKTDMTLNMVYEKKITNYHMHALDVLPASGNHPNSVFLLHSRKPDNTGHFFYHLLELDASLDVVGSTIKTLRQYKNTSNDHTPYSAGKNLVRQTSDGGYVMAGQDEAEYDFLVAKVAPDFDGACGTSFSVYTASNVNGEVYTGSFTTPSSTQYELEVNKYSLPLEYICCADRNGATFSSTDIYHYVAEAFSIKNGIKKDGINGERKSNADEVMLQGIDLLPGSSINLLPNPSSGIFQIQVSLPVILPQPLPAYGIKILDMTGKVVFTKNELKINTVETFDLTGFANGVYTVQVRVGDSYKHICIIKN